VVALETDSGYENIDSKNRMAMWWPWKPINKGILCGGLGKH
jgi:hypothetical protein